jgi:hypothetical protein
MRGELTAIGLTIFLLTPAGATPPMAPTSAPVFIVAQAVVPTAGTEDDKKTITAEQRMQARYPQPVRVGDLIGLPVLDDNARTLGFVRKIVRTKENKIELIVAYGGFLGCGERSVAVPLEVVGVAGRQLTSLDMPRSEYSSAPTWQDAGAQALANDATIKIALSRH